MEGPAGVTIALKTHKDEAGGTTMEVLAGSHQ
jgi:hypothetical protein